MLRLKHSKVHVNKEHNYLSSNMEDPTIPLYIAPFAISNPFQFTVPSQQLSGFTLEKRLSYFISDLAAEKVLPSKPTVDKTLIPQPESWVLLDLGRGTLVHSSSTTAYLIMSVRVEPKIQDGCIILPTIATLTTPRVESTDEDELSLSSKSFCTWCTVNSRSKFG